VVAVKTPFSDSNIVQELRDREDIRDVITAYSRAIDRRDRALLDRLFWADGSCDYGAFRGTSVEFVDWAMNRTAQFSRSQHMLGQILIHVSGERAGAETYFTALQTPIGQTPACADESVSGRYLDRLEKRNGEWRIHTRLVAFEWLRHFPDTIGWPPDVARTLGARAPNDAIYTFLADFID